MNDQRAESAATFSAVLLLFKPRPFHHDTALGQGGKYLVLPPGYKGEVPEGYFVSRSRTFGVWLMGRGFKVNGDLKPGAESIRKNLRIYPLAQAKSPPETKFISASGVELNTVHANDFSYFEELNQIVQEEPSEALDPERLGLFASVGIEKGEPFAPDARTLFFYYATGITPAMALKMVSIGSQYAAAFVDSEGKPLDGSKTYKIHLPPNIPAKDFWSFVVYDNQTRSMLQTDQQFPSIGSLKKELVVNSDTSVDVWFGPTAPQGHESNWVQTVPSKGWNVLIRLYGPLEAWFDKTWRPGEFELVK